MKYIVEQQGGKGMEVIVEQALQQEAIDFANFLSELTQEEKQEVMSFIDGVRFMKRLAKETV